MYIQAYPNVIPPKDGSEREIETCLESVQTSHPACQKKGERHRCLFDLWGKRKYGGIRFYVEEAHLSQVPIIVVMRKKKKNGARLRFCGPVHMAF